MDGGEKPLKNIAHPFLKRCPCFQKTLPVVLENVARNFFKHCRWFFILLPIIFENNEQCFERS